MTLKINGRLLFILKIFIFLTINSLCCVLSAQNSVIDSIPQFFSQDSTYLSHDTIPNGSSLSFTPKDSISTDTIPPNSNKKEISDGAIEKTVTYDAEDSIVIDIRNRMAYLFGNAVVYYDDIELRANFIQISFAEQELYACGVADSIGNMHGYPAFKQGEFFFKAHEIKYNFKTTRGVISHIITTEGEGYIHGEKIKKLEDNTSFIRHGKYTTCELEDPHFEIAFTKAKVIPNDKIVTGPAYFKFGGIPVPLAIPFGYFPLNNGRRSGIIIPTIGESANRGFYLENLGFYFGINDYVDLLLAGDIYTNGSWAAKLRSNYAVRYKCNGTVNISFAQNFFGEKYTPDRYNTNDFKFYWDHRQDPKSHPTTTFSAHIDIVSHKFNTYNSTSVTDYLSNQYTSKLNLSTSAKSIFFVNITASYTQNTLTRNVDMMLPDINMSVVQFYPFRKKNKTSALKWYDNISIKWSSQLTNKISTKDSLIFKRETWEDFQLGMRHNIPITIPIKIAKKINWNTTININEKWYLQREIRDFEIVNTENGSYGKEITNLQRGFYALHDINITTSLTSKIYFMYQFKKGGLKTIRHIISPTLSMSYAPNLSGHSYGEYWNPISGENVQYSYFSNSIFGGVNNKSSAIAKLSISNNLEMKVRSKKDTITGTKKIVLLENLTFSMYYNFLADSLNWSNFSIAGRTTLFKNIYVTFNINFSPYCISNNGVTINRTELRENHRLLRFSSADVSIGLNCTLNKDFFQGDNTKKQKKQQQQQQPLFTENTLGMPNVRPDFDNNWSITINYTFAYNVKDNNYYYMSPNYRLLYNISTDLAKKKYNGQIIQTLNIVGEFNITKKWKIGFTTGYDFTQKKLSYTSIDIYRDLHCWEMRFNWIPFGTRRGWSFTINVKASALQDLKYNMKRDFRENF